MALVFNGTSDSAIHPIVSTTNTAEWSICCTFKTGSTVSGVVQYPVHMNRASSFLRGFGVEISTAGAIRVFRSIGSLLYTASLGTAAANTIYRVVITKNAAGTVTGYLNSFGNSASASSWNVTDTQTRIITGALYDSAAKNFFGGKVARIAKWDSVLSTADITLLVADGHTPAEASVAPSNYWVAVSDDTPTYGATSTSRTGAAYDSDVLGTFVSYSITSVNGGNPVLAGTAFDTVTTGYTAITSASISGFALTGLSFGSNTLTATPPTFVDGVAIYEPDTTQTLSITDGTNTSNTSITASSKSGYTSVLVVSPNLLDDTYAGYWVYALGYTPLDNDRFCYKTSDCTVSSDGGVTAPAAVVTTLWLWQHITGIMREFTMTISDSGKIIGLTSAGITSTGITHSGLTSAGL